ncbi:unnamed protein product [Closterium sp. NIES-64]|nr:unnamed protein product [Closterium sp. NIES-64]
MIAAAHKSGGCAGSGSGGRQNTGAGRQGGGGAGGRGGGAGRTGSGAGAGAGAGRSGRLGGSNSAGKVRQGKKGGGNCSGGSGSCNGGGGGGGSGRNAAAASIQSAGYVVADNRERDRKRDGSYLKWRRTYGMRTTSLLRMDLCAEHHVQVRAQVDAQDVWDSVAIDRLKEACGEWVEGNMGYGMGGRIWWAVRMADTGRVGVCSEWYGVWDSLAIDRLKEANDPSANADLLVVVIQEGWLTFVLQTQYPSANADLAVVVMQEGLANAINKFFENVFQGVQRHIDFNVIRCLLIASHGFTQAQDQFFEYMMLEATRQNIRAIIENKAKIVLAHSTSGYKVGEQQQSWRGKAKILLEHFTSGYKHAVKEVLALPAIMTQIKDTKAAKEAHIMLSGVILADIRFFRILKNLPSFPFSTLSPCLRCLVKALEDFYAMLSNDSARAFYGPGHVEAANERLAIHTLLISDDLFRNADVKTRRRYVDLVESVRANVDVKTRRRYVDLVESVRANGGQVHVFPSLHVSVSPPLPTPVHPLFHSNADVKTRRRYVDLVESVRANGGQVHVFSSLHVSGEQLVNLAGIAAILRFPLPELEDMEL